jgi:hypothetical protein
MYKMRNAFILVRNPDGKILRDSEKDKRNNDWINRSQGITQWRVLMNTGMNLRVPNKAGNFLTS